VGKPSKALASVVTDDELNAAYIRPGVFNADLHTAVAIAVRRAAGGPAELSRETEDQPSLATAYV
jgi:malate dehydrogenase (oxaloacetate-decarboxylating)